MKPTDIDIDRHRKPARAIEPLLYRRWSPRAMSGEALTDDEVMTLFEAARWAPSSYNAQHWRLLYARRATAGWDRFFGLLAEGNRAWAGKAGLLVVLVSRTRFERNDHPARTHSFDCGAAWQNLALQATAMGLVAHAMQGFDYERARTELGVPDGYAVEAMIAVGRPGEIEDLPEGPRGMEVPNGRKPVAEIAREGGF